MIVVVDGDMFWEKFVVSDVIIFGLLIYNGIVSVRFKKVMEDLMWFVWIF